ncbi:MAG: HNH endonuclease [Chloroflexi bacterium]|nr:HNH endonuclease [Chloroflexota bacterium]
MEDYIGRKLRKTEVVHHVNHQKTDNRLENLQLMSTGEHARVHNALPNGAGKVDLTEEQVREAVQGRTTAEAAKALGVNHQTLRNRFGYLLNKRRSPHDLFDPHAIEMVRIAAQDPTLDIKTFAKQTGISASVSKKICEANSFQWIRKSRKGEKRRSYHRKKASPVVSAPGDQECDTVLLASLHEN